MPIKILLLLLCAIISPTLAAIETIDNPDDAEREIDIYTPDDVEADEPPRKNYGDGIYGGFGLGFSTLTLKLNNSQKQILSNKNFTGFGYGGNVIGYRIANFGFSLMIHAGEQSMEGYKYIWTRSGIGVERTIAEWTFSTGQLSRATAGLEISQSELDIIKSKGTSANNPLGEYFGHSLEVFSNLYMLIGSSWGFYGHVSYNVGYLMRGKSTGGGTSLTSSGKIPTSGFKLILGIGYDVAN